MEPATKHIKDTIAALGVPRRSIVARTDLGVTSAAIHDPAHRQLVADRAEELARPGRYGVYITRYPCGCVPTVRVNNDPRRAGQVTTRNEEDLTGHTCPAAPVGRPHGRPAPQADAHPPGPAVTGRPAWVSTHLPAHATTWWHTHRADAERAAQALADHDNTTTEET